MHTSMQRLILFTTESYKVQKIFLKTNAKGINEFAFIEFEIL
jgi:hypothetical protein